MPSSTAVPQVSDHSSSSNTTTTSNIGTSHKRLTARQVTLTEFAQFCSVEGSVLPDALKLGDVDNDGDFECVAGGFYGDVYV
jgi:hypothetical protein